jgi:segregation and condensation protein B
LARSHKPRRSGADQFRRVPRQPGLAADKPADRPGATRKAGSWRRRLQRPRDAKSAAPDAWTRDAPLARLEAVLFLAREPLNTRKLAQLAHLADGTEARTLVRRLNRFYDETGSAFAAEELAGGYQLMSRPKFAAWLGRLHPNPAEVRLSGPALETLAVVAYRQPVMRAEIEAIRGVDCGEILRQLLERNLVRTAGRAEELGRPYLYATTRRFLQVFGLRGLEDLPRAELLRGPATTAPQSHETNQTNQSRESGIHDESLTHTAARENEEGFERDHHRPA